MSIRKHAFQAISKELHFKADSWRTFDIVEGMRYPQELTTAREYDPEEIQSELVRLISYSEEIRAEIRTSELYDLLAYWATFMTLFENPTNMDRDTALAGSKMAFAMILQEIAERELKPTYMLRITDDRPEKLVWLMRSDLGLYADVTPEYQRPLQEFILVDNGFWDITDEEIRALFLYHERTLFNISLEGGDYRARPEYTTALNMIAVLTNECLRRSVKIPTPTFVRSPDNEHQKQLSCVP
jgi:hypothetical protein